MSITPKIRTFSVPGELIRLKFLYYLEVFGIVVDLQKRSLKHPPGRVCSDVVVLL